MKHKILIGLFFISTFSCQKQMEPAQQSLVSTEVINNVKQWLKNTLSSADYASVDFSKGFFSNNLLRLTFLNKHIEQDFLLLQTDSLGNCSAGRIIHLSKDNNATSPGTFNGAISIQSLQRQVITSSPISNGYVQSFHPALFSNVEVNSDINVDLVPSKLPEYEDLPEVVVVGYLPAGGGSGITFGDYLLLESFMSNSSGGGGGTTGGGSSSGGSSGGGSGASGASGTYSPANPTSGTGNSSGSSGSGGLIINYESSPSLPAINVPAYMKCFGEIPDAGAQCSVTIYTDLPVNDDPEFIFNFNTGAVGHSFLQLTKTGSGQSVTQIIGFTAVKPFQAMVSPKPVLSKIVDNQGHKFNASLTMNITPAQLSTEISTIESLSGTAYDLINYNCVNFSVQVMNEIRPGNQLEVPPMQEPGATPLSSTPEGLYVLLSRMKTAGGPEAQNIVTDAVGFSGDSHGPCN